MVRVWYKGRDRPRRQQHEAPALQLDAVMPISTLVWVRSVVLWKKVLVSRVDERGRHRYNVMYSVSQCRALGQFRRAFCGKAPQRVVTLFISLLVSLEPDGFPSFKGFEADGFLLARRRRSKRRSAPVDADRNSAGRQSQSETNRCRNRRVFGCSPLRCRPLRTRCCSNVQIIPEAVCGWIAHETSMLSS